MAGRRAVDLATYARRTREGPCFVCRIVRGEESLPNSIVPYEEQQLAALDLERRGVRNLSAAELEHLAARIRAQL